MSKQEVQSKMERKRDLQIVNQEVASDQGRASDQGTRRETDHALTKTDTNERLKTATGVCDAGDYRPRS